MENEGKREKTNIMENEGEEGKKSMKETKMGLGKNLESGSLKGKKIIRVDML